MNGWGDYTIIIAGALIEDSTYASLLSKWNQEILDRSVRSSLGTVKRQTWCTYGCEGIGGMLVRR